MHPILQGNHGEQTRLLTPPGASAANFGEMPLASKGRGENTNISRRQLLLKVSTTRPRSPPQIPAHIICRRLQTAAMVEPALPQFQRIFLSTDTHYWPPIPAHMFSRPLQNAEPTGVSSDMAYTLFVDLLLDGLPKDGEHEPLHPVGHDLGLEAAPEQPDEAVLRDHVANGLDVRHALRVRLSPPSSSFCRCCSRSCRSRRVAVTINVIIHVVVVIVVIGRRRC